MLSKSTLVLCDTCVIIGAFGTDSWPALVSGYDIVVSQTIIAETLWYPDNNGRKRAINLTPYVAGGKIKVIDPPVSELVKFASEFDISYAERMDPGELSLLCFLFSQSAQEILICSGDEIVFKVLGRHRRSAQGISLEELLQKTGFNKPLRDQFKKDFRENCSSKGFTDSFS
ncbi:MAG: hypothetical protein V2A57_03410 [Elusimicrobiota bacterium]